MHRQQEPSRALRMRMVVDRRLLGVVRGAALDQLVEEFVIKRLHALELLDVARRLDVVLTAAPGPDGLAFGCPHLERTVQLSQARENLEVSLFDRYRGLDVLPDLVGKLVSSHSVDQSEPRVLDRPPT